MRAGKTTAALQCGAIFLALYFSELAQFTLSADEELASFKPFGTLWISQGRWAAYLIETAVSWQTVPFFPLAVFGACCIAAYMLILDAAERSEVGVTELLGFAIFCGFPTWFFIAEFFTNTIATGVGLLTSSTVVWLQFRKSGSLPPVAVFAIQCVLAAFAIASYQSFVLCLIAMSVGVWLLRSRSDIAPIRHLAPLAGVLAASLVLYEVTNQIAMLSFGVERLYTTQRFFRPDAIIADPIGVVRQSFRMMISTLGFTESIYKRPLWAAPLVLLAGLVALALSKPRSPALSLAAAVLLIAVPFALLLLAGGGMPVRTFVALPFVVWIFAFMAMTSDRRWMSWIGIALAVVLVIQSLSMASAYHAANMVAARHDQSMATAISERMAQAPGFDPSAKYSLIAFGGVSFQNTYPRPETSTVGRSFFEYDGGNSYRIQNYRRLMGSQNIQSPSPSQHDRTIGRFAEMPIWPAMRSVIIDGDVVMIKLGKTPNSHNQAALKRLSEKGSS